MIFQSDKDHPCIVQIDGVCSTCPTIHAHFLKVIITKFIHKVQLFDLFFTTIHNMNAKMLVIFCDIQCAFPLFVRIALLVESLADTSLQNFNVFQWSA